MNPVEEKSSDITQLSDDEVAKILWDYHHLDLDLHDEQGNIIADCLIVCGSNEERVAERAAELFNEGRINKIVFSGGKVHERFEEKYGEGLTEAEVFAKIAMESGVPQEAILIENKATNTPQNMTSSAELLRDHGLEFNQIIVVSAAQHERRSLATAQKKIPGKEIRVTSPLESFENFIHDPKYHTGRIRALVGHTLRLEVFGRKGDLVAQEIPTNVVEAYRELNHRGYAPLAVESLTEDMEKLGIDIDLKNTNEQIRETGRDLDESAGISRLSPEHHLPLR